MRWLLGGQQQVPLPSVTAAAVPPVNRPARNSRPVAQKSRQAVALCAGKARVSAPADVTDPAYSASRRRKPAQCGDQDMLHNTSRGPGRAVAVKLLANTASKRGNAFNELRTGRGPQQRLGRAL